MDLVPREVQWHPASGARVRRLDLSGRRARHLVIALGIAGSVFVAGGTVAGLVGLRTRSAADAARHENAALKERQAVLRERESDLAQRWSRPAESGRPTPQPR